MYIHECAAHGCTKLWMLFEHPLCETMEVHWMDVCCLGINLTNVPFNNFLVLINNNKENEI